MKTIVGGARGTTTVYVYDAFGRMVADYEDPVGATPCTTCYLSLDHLGSTRMVTDQNQNVVSRHDFMPFGYELGSGYAGRGSLWGALDPVRQKYTGDEQDNQDLSFFQARYYLLPQGGNSPDPVNFGADILNPQSWNGYSYVMNSPLSNVDPDGLGTICNICSNGSTGGDGTSGGDSGGSIDLGFSSGGGVPPPPRTLSVTSSVSVTISAAPPLPRGNPTDLVVGPLKYIVSHLFRLAP